MGTIKLSKKDRAFIAHQANVMQAEGAQVMQRLTDNPAMFRVPLDQVAIFAAGAFLSHEECDEMMAIMDQLAEPSTLFKADYIEGYRTSYSSHMQSAHPLIDRIEQRICDTLGLPRDKGETIQGQRYQPGQEFKPHCDYFHVEREHWLDNVDRGGQRSWTAMIYLNDVEEGGATRFTSYDAAISPQKGAIVVWNNMKEDGTPNPFTMHAGEPVIRGTKYILTKWFRAGKWG